MRSVPQLSNIHTGTGTHMLHIAEVADVIVGIFYGGIVYQFVVFFHILVTVTKSVSSRVHCQTMLFL